MSVVDGVATAGRLAITLTDYDLVGRSSATVRLARGGGVTFSTVLNVVQAGGVRFAGYVDVVPSGISGKKCFVRVWLSTRGLIASCLDQISYLHYFKLELA
jgi:hypothetical protein